jgi:hypothetical protein
MVFCSPLKSRGRLPESSKPATTRHSSVSRNGDQSAGERSVNTTALLRTYPRWEPAGLATDVLRLRRRSWPSGAAGTPASPEGRRARCQRDTPTAGAVRVSVADVVPLSRALLHRLLCRYDAGEMRLIIAVVLTFSAIVAVSQQEIPRFKGGVDVVQFTVTVLDKDRRPVSGLTASDFDVLVDGKLRPLAAFAAVTLPDDPSVRAASIPPVAPDVHTNRLPAEGRLVVIVMDRSIPDGQPMQAAHAVANAVIDRLGPNDLGAVG